MLKQKTNINFNSSVNLFFKNKFTKRFISVGKPGEILINSGIPDYEIIIYPSTLAYKVDLHSLEEKHLIDLPLLINNPAAIFLYNNYPDAKNILIEKTNHEGFLIVGIHINKEFQKIEVNEIATIHGRTVDQLIRWIESDLMIFANKQKIEDLIIGSQINSAKSNKILDLLSKYTNKNENSSLGSATILEQNKQYSDLQGYKPTYKQLENYDHLISPGSGKALKIYSSNNLENVLKDVHNLIDNFSWEVKPLAKYLKDSNISQSIFNVWHFCVNNIKYQLEPDGEEILRTPSKAWRDRFTPGIDCDCFTIFTCSLLKEMGYSPSFCVIAQNGNSSFTHIYTVINSKLNGLGIIEGGIICDPVMSKQFNRHPDNITKSILMKISNLDGLGKKADMVNEISKHTGIEKIGIATPDAVTLQLMKYQSDLIFQLKTNKSQSLQAELRKVRALILMNGQPERDTVLKLIPLITDIDKNGNWIYKDAETAAIYLSKLQNKQYGLGLDLNPFNTSSGGKKWSINEANNYYSKAPGKVEHIRTVVNLIIGQDLDKVESNRKNDYNNLVIDAKAVKVSIEERWKLLQAYAGASGAEILNGYFGNSSGYLLSYYIYDSPGDSVNVGKSGIIKTITRTATTYPSFQETKMQEYINQYALKDPSGRAIINFNGGFNSPNLSMFPPAVLQEIINGGYWFALIPSSANEGGFSNAQNRAEAKFNYDKILILEKWADDAFNKRHSWTHEDVFEAGYDVALTLLNPGIILVKAGVLLAMSTNFRNMARKAYISYMTPEELTASGYTVDDQNKMKATQAKFNATWDKAAGKQANLDRAIRDGNKKKPWFGKGQLAGLSGEGSTIGVILSAIGVITAFIKSLNDSGVSFKKKESDNPDDATDIIPDDVTNPTTWQELGFSSEQEYKDYLANGGPSAGSFATCTIDNWHDFFNYLKGSCAMLLGAQFAGVLIPMQIGISLMLIYALRFKIFSSLNINLKTNCYGKK